MTASNSRAIVDAIFSMGECSFGQNFGQIDPTRPPPKGVDEEAWRSVPRSIFQNQSNKYGVCPSNPHHVSLETNSDRLSSSRDFCETLESTGNLTGLRI